VATIAMEIPRFFGVDWNGKRVCHPNKKFKKMLEKMFLKL
jgi:hypothetical protein